MNKEGPVPELVERMLDLEGGGSGSTHAKSWWKALPDNDRGCMECECYRLQWSMKAT